jgi:glycerol-3-phosphate acyltransferase PlsX
MDLPVAVDAMGGDHAPHAIVAGAVMAVRAGYKVELVGDETRIRPLLPRGVDISIHHTAEAVGMDEAAAVALRGKPDASVRRIFARVASGDACAAVTCGNTGAAMASAFTELGRLPGVQRPALVALVPRMDGGRLVLLDLGANVDVRPELLLGFARMGDAFARTVLEIDSPKVALLSNGEEEGKGNDTVRSAFPLLAASGLNFAGNMEPAGAMRGGCDVLVCDGFSGNIMLKTVESTVQLVGQLLREEINRRTSARFGAWLIQGAFRRFRARTEEQAAGGAVLLGVEGVVVVGHGRSDAVAVAAAIQHAARQVEVDLLGQLRVAMAKTA